VLLLLIACKAPPADPEFNDAAVEAIRQFNAEDPVVLAFAVRQLESVLADVDPDGSLVDRSSEPERLTDADVDGYGEHPDLDPALAIGVSVTHFSAEPMAGHVRVQTLADQTPIEPNSPEVYDRILLEGADCWADVSCEFLRTENPLIKDNAAMTLDYTLWKDFRWVDLNLPSPSEVPDGETATNDGDPRWAIVGTSWIKEETVAQDGTSILQSYSLEVWIPSDDGTLRNMALWSETDSSFSEDIIASTTRSGIQGIFDAADEWLVENP
jgi:hypothetical protein